MENLEFKNKLEELKNKATEIITATYNKLTKQFENETVKIYFIGKKPVRFKNGRLNKTKTQSNNFIYETKQTITQNNHFWYIMNNIQYQDKCILIDNFYIEHNDKLRIIFPLI